MLFLGIDMGTSYFKAGLFNKEGKLVGAGRIRVPKRISGVQAELGIADFWRSLQQCIDIAFKEAMADRRTLTAIAYASQANTFVLADAKGRPLTPLILWTDERSSDDRELTGFAAREQWQETTGIGIPFGAGFCICKCRWFQENTPGLWSKAAAVLTLPDYLVWCLTGKRVIDTGTASLLGLMDLDKQSWWTEALRIAAIDEEQLSRLGASGTDGGRLRPGNPLGLPAGVPLFLGGLDHHMAAVGVGIGTRARLSESTGTVIAAVLYSHNRKRLKEVCMAPALETGTYFKMSFDRNGAGALEWYRETFAPQYTIEALCQLAATVSPGSEGMIALPCAHLYEGRTGFLYQQRRFHHGHYVRAIMESTAMSLKQLIERVDAGQESDAVFSTGGGAKSILWGTIKEAMIERKFYRNENSEAACRGAAMIAAAGAGIFASVFKVQQAWLPDE